MAAGTFTRRVVPAIGLTLLLLLALRVATVLVLRPHYMAVYQPADRFWRFQATELIVNLALAAGSIAASVWWLIGRPLGR